MELKALEVARWAHGGDGVANVQHGPLAGMVVFIEGGVPGDVVNVRVTRRKKRWAKASITSFVSQSEDRREVPCRVQQSCGGCPWMAGNRAVQARSRLAILRGEAKKRLGWSVTQVEQRVRLAPEAGDEFSYRIRLRLRYEVSPEGTCTLGFREARSRRLVPISRCEVASDTVNGALPALADAIASREHGLGEVQILGADGEVGARIMPEGRASWPWGAATLTVGAGAYRWTASPAHFAQANISVTSALMYAIREHLLPAAYPGSHAVEFFAGSGTLTRTLSEAGYSVTAYEVDSGARRLFERQTEGADVTFYVTDLLESGVPLPAPQQPEVILLDPPRIGAAPLMPWIRLSGARQVIMVSCDVSTAMRDLASLSSHYDIRIIEGWDMFPHTGHQEVLGVAFLKGTAGATGTGR